MGASATAGVILAYGKATGLIPWRLAGRVSARYRLALGRSEVTMQGWTSVTIKRSTDDDGSWKLLQDSFEEVFMMAGGPAGAAMYKERDMIGKDLTFYFSPDASKLFVRGLALHHGEPSERPTADQVSLLVGHTAATDPATL